MVLLSGKRKNKDNDHFIKQFIKPYLENKREEFKENILSKSNKLNPCYKQLVHLLDTMVQTSYDLSYQFKTIIRLNPEYEIYHLIYGKPTKYNNEIIDKIKDCLNKNYPISKIKYIISICPN